MQFSKSPTELKPEHYQDNKLGSVALRAEQVNTMPTRDRRRIYGEEPLACKIKEQGGRVHWVPAKEELRLKLDVLLLVLASDPAPGISPVGSQTYPCPSIGSGAGDLTGGFV
jgi:hypothetical protein